MGAPFRTIEKTTSYYSCNSAMNWTNSACTVDNKEGTATGKASEGDMLIYYIQNDGMTTKEHFENRK